MKRAIVACVLGTVLTGGGLAAGIAPAPAAPSAKAGTAAKAAAPAPRPPSANPQAEHLTKKIYIAEGKLRTERDPAERQALADQIETYKHELGPRDSTGTRVQCQAMWHQAAIDLMDAEYRRLAGHTKTASPAALAIDARAHLRRMAGACLTRAWTGPAPLPKYQFDAYGAYLVNNMPVLDAMLEAIAAGLSRESSAGPAGPDRDALLAALAQAKDGIARMGQSVEQFATAHPKKEKEREDLMATFAAFHQGLEAVYEAEATLRELAEKQNRAETGGESSAPSAAHATEFPTADEKAQLEKVRKTSAALGDAAAWKSVRDALERFAAVAEQGLQVQRVRPGAQELLAWLGRTADYVQGLVKSKSAYPEYLASRQESLGTALGYLADKKTRQYAYSRLRRIVEGAVTRSVLDAAPLSAEASRGILRANGLSHSDFPGKDGARDYVSFRAAADAVLDVLAKARGWPPGDLAAQLAPLYPKYYDVFIKSAEAAGKAPLDDPAALKDAYSAAGTFARDLERLVKANVAIRAVEQYLPARAGPMYAEVIRRTENLPGNLTAVAVQNRAALDQFLQPFQDLAGLRLPGPDLQRACATLTGGAYSAALAMLGKQVTTGLTDASKGRSDTLGTALEPKYMFRTLRHRAVAEAAGLSKAGTADMDAFSMPEKTWTAFVAALDGHLRRLFAQYAGEKVLMRSPSCQFLSKWDTVYCWVGAAQRLTLQDRHPGESDLDYLMRNLAQAADPTPPDTAWFGWAVGYHAIEAAIALAAGFQGTADWHLSELHAHRVENRFDRELTSAVFDPVP